MTLKSLLRDPKTASALTDAERALQSANEELDRRARLAGECTCSHDTGRHAESTFRRILGWAPFALALLCAAAGTALLCMAGAPQ